MAVNVFFFFQAEDGIRDDLVTGVQTCALPIWAKSLAAAWDGDRYMVFEQKGTKRLLLATRLYLDSEELARSEERRVGKEGRSRCGTDVGRERGWMGGVVQ